MKAIIKINTDNDFSFNPMNENNESFPITIPVSNTEEGLQAIRDWIWINATDMQVGHSAERQKDHIKLHTGNRRSIIENELSNMYAHTYRHPNSAKYVIYHELCGNWSFKYEIVK